MAITRLQNSYYTVADVGRARAFYETGLGLPVKFADATRWVQFGIGGTNFALAAPEEAAAGARGAVIVFETDDLDAMRGRVAEAGGTVLGERDMGSHGRTLTVADPDGNILQLFERARATATGQAGG